MRWYIFSVVLTSESRTIGSTAAKANKKLKHRRGKQGTRKRERNHVSHESKGIKFDLDVISSSRCFDAG